MLSFLPLLTLSLCSIAFSQPVYNPLQVGTRGEYQGQPLNPFKTSGDDFLPLSVGNEWTYKYLTSYTDYLGDFITSDSGQAAYRIVSKQEADDSTLWNFWEIRDLHETTFYLPPNDNLEFRRINDTIQFVLIEYKTGNHRLVRAGADDWKSVFQMTLKFSDSLSYFRYHPEVNADTFTATAASPADNPYQLATTFYRRYQGIVKTSYKQTKIVGSAAMTNHTLIRTTISVPADDSLRREFFPLHKGDTWQYLRLTTDLPPHAPDWPIYVSVVDTLMPNGYRYAGISMVGSPGTFVKFLRVDSLLRVQEYHPELGDTCGGAMNELNTYRLGERDSSIWQVCSNMNISYFPNKILLRYEGLSGDGMYMSFLPGDPGSEGGTPRWALQAFKLQRGVGVVSTNNSDGGYVALWGAVINGKKFGNTITAVEREKGSQPLAFSLEQNYPNPFNPSTAISYSIPTRAHVVIRIFNAIGQLVATLVDETKAAGTYTTLWNALRMSSGVYYYRMRAGAFTQTNRMVIVK